MSLVKKTTLSSVLHSRATLWRWGVAAATLVIITLSHSSSAEFETPFVDTTNGIANVEFRGVWAFDRGTDKVSTINQYEAFAVGIDTSITTCPSQPDKSYCNGVVYLYNGIKWSRITSPATSTANAYSFNAITGIMNESYGTLRALWVVGPDGKATALANYNAAFGTTSLVCGPQNTSTCQFPIPNCVQPDTFCITGAEKRDYYAVDAAPDYLGVVLAGGQEGLLAKSIGVAYGSMTKIVAANTPGSTENITGIRFVNKTVAYVTTSTFRNDPSDPNHPKAPFQHDCTGNQTGRLYKADFTAGGDGVWTSIISASENRNCFYGLTTTLTDTQKAVVWVATEHGMRRYTESDGAWASATAASGSPDRPYYTAVAVTQRGGSTTNLLRNNNFSLSPITPVGWTVLGQIGFSRWYKTSAGVCTPETAETQISTTGGNAANDPYLLVKSRAIWADSNCTTQTSPGGQKIDDGFTTGAYQTIPNSTTEGQRFKISGDYKVDFPNDTLPAPSKAQGGVVLTCAGNNVQNTPGTVDCSMSNRKLVLTPTSAAINQLTHTSSWIHFSMTISREDGIFNTIIRNYGSDIHDTKRKLDLQVRCEATYGATVSCDNLVVEPLDQPATQPRNTVTVIGAGADIAANGMAVDDDALNSLSFGSEGIPNKVRLDVQSNIKNQVNSLYAVGSQHIFAAGQGYDVTNPGSPAPVGLAIFNRTPSTLQGTIWVGAFSPTSAIDKAAVGTISVSCIDDKDANNVSLCQRVPESYGMSLEITSASNVTKTGRLTGQAWFGKVADSQESLDLGKCINPPDAQQKLTYATAIQNGGDGAGVCDYNAVTNTGSRRCKGIDANGNIINPAISPGTLTSVSCITNFDCLGRCEKDSGFVCLKDTDCQVGKPATVDPWNATQQVGLQQFAVPPANRLTCGGTQASPLACTPTGWLSFNANDFSAGSTTPPSGSFGVTYNTLFTAHNQSLGDVQNQGAHELSGWGRFMTLASNNGTGWVNLRGASTAAVGATINGAPNLFACRNCDSGQKDQMNCAFCQDASTHSCVPSDAKISGTQLPESQCYNVCKDDTTKHCSTVNDCTAQGATGPCISPGFCTTIPAGNQAFACTEDADCTVPAAPGKPAGPGGTCAIGAVCSTAGAQCAKYGVNLDTNTGKFIGYAWSQDFGWLNFANVSYGGNRIIQTKLGDIYATGQIGNSSVPLPPGGSSCNSTFLITSASSITGFCSALGENITSATGTNVLPTKLPNSAAIPFLSADNTYQNVLGRFDLVGLEKESPVGTGKNKYGSPIVTLTAVGASNNISANWNAAMSTNTSPAGGKYLGGKVYVIGAPGSTITYQLDAPMNFNNSDDKNNHTPGAGILIVNGNLIISNDMTYNAGNVSLAPDYDLRRLASLTIIVKGAVVTAGNIDIANSVQNIVGAYYVTNAVTTSTNAATNQFPLTVHGLMIAKQFNFKRTFAGTIENPLPSELIINDGRLQSNPMLGMTDFASSLPNSVSVAP